MRALSKNNFFSSAFLCVFLFSLFFLPLQTASADTAASTQQNQIINAANTQQDAFDAAFDVSIPGPAKIPLGEQGVLDLPDNYFFIPAKEAAKLLHTLGNKTGPEFMGLVIPKEHVHWYITVDFIKSGFISDSDVNYWNNDELLDDIRKSTAEENQESIAAGSPASALQVKGWIEAPHYNKSSHMLIWSVLGKFQNDSSDSNHESINYNTYLLGREGYFNLNLITSSASLPDDKTNAQAMLNALHFNTGKRYEDFNPKTNATAGYHLSTLITGRIQKVSVLALTGFVIEKSWQVALLFLLIWAFVAKRIYRRKLSTENV
jgi:uncharacterized membrane-anchored protein